MEKLRRLVTGRISELLGEATLPIDKFFRSVAIHESAAWQAE
jgi:acyl-homoserine lactone acylase PvdQ